MLPDSSPIPSWAWSGWKGAIHYGIETQMLDGADAAPHDTPAESLILGWHIVDQDGSIVRLDVTRNPPSWNLDGPGGPGVTVDLENPLAPFRYVAPQANPSDLLLDFSPPYGTLVFRTQCTHFQAMKVDEGRFPMGPSMAIAHTVFDIVPVDDVAPHCAGRIILPISTPSPTILELAVLSRCDGIPGFWNENRWGKRYYGCTLHVMALRHTEHDPRVNERMGLGIVVESAWMESRAKERVVLLV